jgi:maltose-binding protein MalE
MDKLKSLWAKFKVQISFVAGCLVVATSMGTCSFDPSATSEDASNETTTETVEITTDNDVNTEAAVNAVETVNDINDVAVNNVDVSTDGDTELTDVTTASEVTE